MIPKRPGAWLLSSFVFLDTTSSDRQVCLSWLSARQMRDLLYADQRQVTSLIHLQAPAYKADVGVVSL